MAFKKIKAWFSVHKTATFLAALFCVAAIVIPTTTVYTLQAKSENKNNSAQNAANTNNFWNQTTLNIQIPSTDTNSPLVQLPSNLLTKTAIAQFLGNLPKNTTINQQTLSSTYTQLFEMSPAQWLNILDTFAGSLSFITNNENVTSLTLNNLTVLGGAHAGKKIPDLKIIGFKQPINNALTLNVSQNGNAYTIFKQNMLPYLMNSTYAWLKNSNSDNSSSSSSSSSTSSSSSSNNNANIGDVPACSFTIPDIIDYLSQLTSKDNVTVSSSSNSNGNSQTWPYSFLNADNWASILTTANIQYNVQGYQQEIVLSNLFYNNEKLSNITLTGFNEASYGGAQSQADVTSILANLETDSGITATTVNWYSVLNELNAVNYPKVAANYVAYPNNNTSTNSTSDSFSFNLATNNNSTNTTTNSTNSKTPNTNQILSSFNLAALLANGELDNLISNPTSEPSYLIPEPQISVEYNNKWYTTIVDSQWNYVFWTSYLLNPNSTNDIWFANQYNLSNKANSQSVYNAWVQNYYSSTNSNLSNDIFTLKIKNNTLSTSTSSSKSSTIVLNTTSSSPKSNANAINANFINTLPAAGSYASNYSVGNKTQPNCFLNYLHVNQNLPNDEVYSFINDQLTFSAINNVVPLTLCLTLDDSTHNTPQLWTFDHVSYGTLNVSFGGNFSQTYNNSNIYEVNINLANFRNWSVMFQNDSISNAYNTNVIAKFHNWYPWNYVLGNFQNNSNSTEISSHSFAWNSSAYNFALNYISPIVNPLSANSDVNINSVTPTFQNADLYWLLTKSTLCVNNLQFNNLQNLNISYTTQNVLQNNTTNTNSTNSNTSSAGVLSINDLSFANNNNSYNLQINFIGFKDYNTVYQIPTAKNTPIPQLFSMNYKQLNLYLTQFNKSADTDYQLPTNIYTLTSNNYFTTPTMNIPSNIQNAIALIDPSVNFVSSMFINNTNNPYPGQYIVKNITTKLQPNLYIEGFAAPNFNVSLTSSPINNNNLSIEDWNLIATYLNKNQILDVSPNNIYSWTGTSLQAYAKYYMNASSSNNALIIIKPMIQKIQINQTVYNWFLNALSVNITWTNNGK